VSSPSPREQWQAHAPLLSRRMLATVLPGEGVTVYLPFDECTLKVYFNSRGRTCCISRWMASLPALAIGRITTWCGGGEGFWLISWLCMCVFVFGRGGYPLFNAYLGVAWERDGSVELYLHDGGSTHWTSTYSTHFQKKKVV